MCVRACVRVCVRACVRACIYMCVDSFAPFSNTRPGDVSWKRNMQMLIRFPVDRSTDGSSPMRSGSKNPPNRAHWRGNYSHPPISVDGCFAATFKSIEVHTKRPVLASSRPRDGTGRDGTGRDGTGRDGTGRDGTGRDGTGRDGTGRDGTGRDGTGRGVCANGLWGT